MVQGDTVKMPQEHEAAEPTESRRELVDFAEDAIESLDDLPFVVARKRVIESFERHYVVSALSRANGNVAQAAVAAGLSLRYFQLLKARIFG
jgi:hypothetical protein